MEDMPTKAMIAVTTKAVAVGIKTKKIKTKTNLI